MSKGSKRRRSTVSIQIADLRYDLAFGTEEKKRLARETLIALGEIGEQGDTRSNTNSEEIPS
jgi:hypothetical protein